MYKRGKNNNITIMHIIYKLDHGGLENGVVNIVNNLTNKRIKHIILSLKAVTNFKERLKHNTVVLSLNKKEGNDIASYVRAYKLFRKYKPDIVHTRNLAAFEMQFIAFLACVPYRIHGEHGRDIHDLYGKNKKYRILKKLLSKLVHRVIAVSKELERYLVKELKLSDAKVLQINNGVDTDKFRPRRLNISEYIYGVDDLKGRVIIGSVGRLEVVKDHENLILSINELLKIKPLLHDKIKLLIVGDGSLRQKLETKIIELQLNQICHLVGSKEDIQSIINTFDIFVLPSIAEGMSNTILESMACGLPIIATDVGANSDLVKANMSGFIVPTKEPKSLANALLMYIDNADLRLRHGSYGREIIERDFSLLKMVHKYSDLYTNFN